jgi:hypothetical protein
MFNGTLVETAQEVVEDDQPFEARVLHSRLGDIYAIDLPWFNRHDRRIILRDDRTKEDKHARRHCGGPSKALPDAKPRNHWPKRAEANV